MSRVAVRLGAGVVLAAGVLGAVAQAQPGGIQDKVYLRDKKGGPPRAKEGTLKVTAGGYEIVPPGGGKGDPVPYQEIIRLVPGEASVPGLDRKDVNSLLVLEEDAEKDGKRDYDKALLSYQDVRKRMPTAQEKTKRFLDFKIATLTAKVADATPFEAGWNGRAEEAVKLLKTFTLTYPGGWEAWPAGSALARIQGELGKYAEAGDTWAKLAKDAAGVPAALRQEAELQVVDSLIRAKQYPEAAARVGDLKDLAGAAKDRAAIYALAAKWCGDANPANGVDAIEAEIAKAKDPVVRGTGYSMLGELYLAGAKPKPRDAMWAFLWVEVVYNHDRDEVVKAMTRVAEIFDAQKDEDHARAYREKIRRYRGAL
jgi:hypothetical protein